MARVNVYVTDDLKARMDRAGDLNWSTAAQRAFEIEIQAQEWKMVENRIERTVERLRASKAQEDGELKAEGRKAGVEWANEDASFRVLRAVANFEWGSAPPEFYGYHLACLILNQKSPSDPAGAGELWDELCGGHMTEDSGSEPDPAWLEGFVDGAMTVWDEVKGELESILVPKQRRLPDDLRVEMLGKSPRPGTGREARYKCLRAAEAEVKRAGGDFNVAAARRALVKAFDWRNTASTLRAFDEMGYLRLDRGQIGPDPRIHEPAGKA
jgi:hypothetical protein